MNTDRTDPSSPTMIRLPTTVAREIAENMQAFATYYESSVAPTCTTDHGRKAAERTAEVLRSYAAGLLEASK